MSIKKIITIISILIGVCFLAGLVFYWKVLLDPQSPEFAAAQGEFIITPEVEKADNIYTITWYTLDDYPSNEVLMKSSKSKYPDAGVEADSVYDENNKLYRHNAKFRLSNNKESAGIPTFSIDEYVYQIKSSGLTDKVPVISAVKSL